MCFIEIFRLKGIPSSGFNLISAPYACVYVDKKMILKSSFFDLTIKRLDTDFISQVDAVYSIHSAIY